jgi:hypothetical protein
MFRSTLTSLTFGLAIVGIACAVLAVARGSMSFPYLAWHVIPYVIVAILSIAIPKWCSAWLGAAALMCVVDAWVLSETMLGTRSPLLMSAGLLATLKLPVLLPIGAAIGGLLGRFARS